MILINGSKVIVFICGSMMLSVTETIAEMTHTYKIQGNGPVLVRGTIVMAHIHAFPLQMAGLFSRLQ